MGTITHGGTLPDSSQKTDFYSIIDNATVTGIVNADCASTMALVDTKLASITTAGKVDGSAITNLANTPSGAGTLPLANTQNYIPSGGIIMWSGTIATIPSGWVLCDGTNSTPDLRNRFIVGANADSGGIAKSTITGSAAQSGGSTTISQANLPSYNLSFTRYDGNGSGLIGVQGTNNGASASSQTVASGGSGTAYTQPFYALAYIMKT